MAFLPIERVRVDQAFSDGLPTPSKNEFEGLLQDIQTRGIVVDLIVTEDGLLLDGHRRFAAAQRLGLKEVPVKTIDCSGEGEWQKALMLALNLCRRHMGQVQRAVLGTSLLRLERSRAKDRQKAAQERGRKRRWHECLDLGAHHPDPRPKPPDRATERVAQRIGISRQSLERVEAIKNYAPDLMQRMLEGHLSITRAYRMVKIQHWKAKADCSPVSSSGLLDSLEPVFGKYHAVYLDPPWPRRTPPEHPLCPHPPSQSLEQLPLRELAQKDGCHFWLRCPLSLIRSGTLHEFLEKWGLKWQAEILFDRGTQGRGHWFYTRMEVLILAVVGNLPLLRSDVSPVHLLTTKGGKTNHDPIYSLIQELSPGPRIELLASQSRRGWDGWRENPRKLSVSSSSDLDFSL